MVNYISVLFLLSLMNIPILAQEAQEKETLASEALLTLAIHPNVATGAFETPQFKKLALALLDLKPILVTNIRNDSPAKKKTTVKFICEECRKKFVNKHQLAAHSYVHSPETKPFKCTIADCDRRFIYETQIKTHLARHHKA